MKYRYQFHPYDYALGENEKFYSDMEQKGWRLVKRGSSLSKFIPTEPRCTRYRIEIVPPGHMEDGCTLPEEQQAVYEDCGWEYVTGQKLLHIFRAPIDSDAPEFYENPSEQAASVEMLRKQYRWSWIPTAVSFLCNFFWIKFLAYGDMSLWYKTLIEQTAGVGLYVLSLFWLLYMCLRRTWYLNRTCRQLKQGVPLDHAPQDRHLAHQFINGILLALMGLCAVLMAVQLLGANSVDLPQQADGPYLLLKDDLGWDMDRTCLMDKESSLTCTKSLLGDYWDVFEVVGKNSATVWLYQDIYRLRSPDMARNLANALRNTTTFGKNAEDCYVYVMDDMTAWVYADLEIVVVSGNMAANITYSGYIRKQPEDLQSLLKILRDRWEEYGLTTAGKTEE